MTKFKVKIGDGTRQWNELPYIGGDSSVLHNGYTENNITIDSNTTENHVYILNTPISAFTITVDAIMASESIVSFKASTDFSLTVAGAQASNIKRIGSFDFKANNEYTISICGDSLVSSVGAEMPSMLATEYRQNEMSGEATTKTSPISIDGDTITISKNIHDVVHVDYADYRIENNIHLKLTLAVLASRNTDYKTDDVVGCVNSNGNVDWTYTQGSSENELFAVVKSDAVLYVCDKDNALYVYDSTNDEFRQLNDGKICEVSYIDYIYNTDEIFSGTHPDRIMNNSCTGLFSITPRMFFLKNAKYFEENESYYNVFSNSGIMQGLSIYSNNNWTWLKVFEAIKRLRYSTNTITDDEWMDLINSDSYIIDGNVYPGIYKYLQNYKLNMSNLSKDRIYIKNGKIISNNLDLSELVTIDKGMYATKTKTVTLFVPIDDTTHTYINNVDMTRYNDLTIQLTALASSQGKEIITYLTCNEEKTTPITIELPQDIRVVGNIPELTFDANTTHIISIHDNIAVFGTAKTLQD